MSELWLKNTNIYNLFFVLSKCFFCYITNNLKLCIENIMLDRTQKNDQLTTALSVLSTTITNKSKQSMLDDNRVLETILPTLLNTLYGYSLVDLNIEKYNHPAIDLGDYFKGKAIQITADGSKSKMVDTITMLEKHNLHIQYKDITFLIISNSPKQSFERKGYVISVIDLGDIARDICSLPSDRFDAIYYFCENELRNYFPNNNQSFFQPTFVPSNDPNLDISNFMNCSGFQQSYDVSIDDMRNGLISLKEMLSGLNDDQRWFLFRIMDWSIKFNQNDIYECCIAPYHYMVSGLSYQNSFAFKSTAKSLESMNIAYYEDEPTWKFDFPHFGIHFSYQVEDYNFFSGICMFLSDNYHSDKLSKIIVNCDFSDID